LEELASTTETAGASIADAYGQGCEELIAAAGVGAGSDTLPEVPSQDGQGEKILAETRAMTVAATAEAQAGGLIEKAEQEVSSFREWADGQWSSLKESAFGSMVADAVKDPVGFITGVDNDRVAQILADQLSKAEGTTDNERVSNALVNVMGLRNKNVGDRDLAAAEHFLVASNGLHQGGVGYGQVVLAPIYDPGKALIYPFRDVPIVQKYTRMDPDKPISVPTVGSMIWSILGVYHGATRGELPQQEHPIRGGNDE
jgi:hypothetical protein